MPLVFVFICRSDHGSHRHECILILCCGRKPGFLAGKGRRKRLGLGVLGRWWIFYTLAWKMIGKLDSIRVKQILDPRWWLQMFWKWSSLHLENDQRSTLTNMFLTVLKLPPGIMLFPFLILARCQHKHPSNHAKIGSLHKHPNLGKFLRPMIVKQHDKRWAVS